MLTFAPSVLTFAPCALTFAPCTYGVILLSTSAGTPHAHMVMVTSCNLHWWHFSFSHLHKHSLRWWWCNLLQLALVVFFLPPTGAHTPLALEQLALCGGSIYMYIFMYICVRTLCKQVLQLHKLDAAPCAGVKQQLETSCLTAVLPIVSTSLCLLSRFLAKW